MRFRYLTADVFTDRVFGGNPLAVFPDAAGIDPNRMQAVAREFNLSETVFVLPPEEPRHTRRLRIFTPGRELPFAGHPTVGTALALAWLDAIGEQGEVTEIVLEEGVGPVPVTLRQRDGQAHTAQLAAPRLPEIGPPPPASDALAAMLSLTPEDISASGRQPLAVSSGVPFTFVPLRDRAAVARARLRRDLWEATLADHWAPSLFIVAEDADESGNDLHARMFAPAFGVDEDPATGAAAAALPGFLFADGAAAEGTHRWRLEQGYEMGRPSLIEIEADVSDGAMAGIRVAGAAVLVSKGEMEIPAGTT